MAALHRIAGGMHSNKRDLGSAGGKARRRCDVIDITKPSGAGESERYLSSRPRPSGAGSNKHLHSSGVLPDSTCSRDR
jgi:hypothetical protein